MYKEEKELWVKFASAALCGFTAIDCIRDHDDVIADCQQAAEYADVMVSLFYDKFRDC